MARKPKVLADLSQNTSLSNGECFETLARGIETMSGSIVSMERDFLVCHKADPDKAKTVFDENYLCHVMRKDRSADYHSKSWQDVLLVARSIMDKPKFSDKAKDQTGRQTKRESAMCSSVRMARMRLLADNTVRTQEELDAAKDKADKAKAKRDKTMKAAQKKERDLIRTEERKKLETSVPKFDTFEALLAHVSNERARLSQIIDRNSSQYGGHAEVFAALRSAVDELSKVPAPVIEKKASKKKTSK